MANKLGYTWYPENWWTSDEFFDLEEHPLVRYAYREIIDLLHLKKGYTEITQRTIKSRFRINLSDTEYELLKKCFNIDGDMWSTEKVNKRLRKAETSRINGGKGGAPKGNSNARKKQPENNLEKQLKTTQKQLKTTKNNPEISQVVSDNDTLSADNQGIAKNNQPTKTTQNNPPFKREREREKEIEIKKEIKRKNDPYPFEKFWNDYDFKKSTGKCSEKWKKISEEDRQKIKAVVKTYVAATTKDFSDSNSKKQFRKHPLTWLNGKCWEDEIESSEIESNTKKSLEELLYG